MSSIAKLKMKLESDRAALTERMREYSHPEDWRAELAGIVRMLELIDALELDQGRGGDLTITKVDATTGTVTMDSDPDYIGFVCRGGPIREEKSEAELALERVRRLVNERRGDLYLSSSIGGLSSLGILREIDHAIEGDDHWINNIEPTLSDKEKT